MEIDKETGNIQIQELGFIMGPNLTLAEFLSFPDISTKRIFDSDDDRREFCLNETFSFKGMDFRIHLIFIKGFLCHMFLWNTDPQYDQDPVSWDEHKERMRKASHDGWLEKLFGNSQNEFPWGVAISDYNPIAGESCVIIAYQKSEP